MPKGLTTSVAATTINEHRKTLEDSKLKEYDAYYEILEEFDDSDFREINEIKKPSRAILLDAIDRLLKEGKTYEYLSNHIDDVVDKVKEIKPDLERK